MVNKIINRIIEIFKTAIDLYHFEKIVRSNKEKFVILISHSADSSGGAPVVLFELAKKLKEEGNTKVIFLINRKGSLTSLCKKNNIMTFETFYLYKFYLKSMNKNKDNIECVVVNTVVNYFYLQYLEKLRYNGKIIWWIHESKDLLLKYSEKIRNYNLPYLINCCVSNNIVENIRKFCETNIKDFYILPYGIQDNGILIERQNKTFNISIIGRISERKNQLELIRAYDMLPSTLRPLIHVNIVAGSVDRNYFEKLKKVIANNPNVKVKGPIPREYMKKIYENSDLIVCTSKDDPLPVVITEAMMYGKLFITSNKTGQSSFIKNGYNGYVYNIGDTKYLSSFIKNVYTNYSDYSKVRKEARNLYLKSFSVQGVYNNFRNLLEKM